jgi:hypothetical protein
MRELCKKSVCLHIVLGVIRMSYGACFVPVHKLKNSSCGYSMRKQDMPSLSQKLLAGEVQSVTIFRLWP